MCDTKLRLENPRRFISWGSIPIPRAFPSPEKYMPATPRYRRGERYVVPVAAMAQNGLRAGKRPFERLIETWSAFQVPAWNMWYF